MLRTGEQDTVEEAVAKTGLHVGTARWHDENLVVLLNALIKARPSSAKGRYVLKVTLSSTMGPGVNLDLVAVTRSAERI